MGGNNPVLTAVREAEQLWGFHSICCVRPFANITPLYVFSYYLRGRAVQVTSVGTGQFPRRKNRFLSAENAGRSLLGNMASTGVFRSLVSTAVSAGSTVGLMQMLGDLAVASDDQHENAVRTELVLLDFMA